MADEQLLTISTFARAVGVPASALRHYAAQHVLEPAEVDPVTGYRYYAPAQIDRGVLVRRMRSAEVPLPVMRQVLTTPAQEASALLTEVLTDHGATSTRREEELRALQAQLSPVLTRSARATVPGAVLSHAISQVLPAASTAADDVAGLVWALGEHGLELSATDRYWLAHRRIAARSEGGPARAITAPQEASAIAHACARRGDVHLDLTEEELRISATDGTVLARCGTVERSVPDLGLLVSTQPAARVVAGFERAALSEHLARPQGASPLRLVTHGESATLHMGRVLQGWASPGAGGPGQTDVLLQSALLAAAVTVCPGEEIVLSVVDGSTPVRVGSPVQDTATSLVMPMLP